MLISFCDFLRFLGKKKDRGRIEYYTNRGHLNKTDQSQWRTRTMIQTKVDLANHERGMAVVRNTKLPSPKTNLSYYRN